MIRLNVLSWPETDIQISSGSILQQGTGITKASVKPRIAIKLIFRSMVYRHGATISKRPPAHLLGCGFDFDSQKSFTRSVLIFYVRGYFDYIAITGRLCRPYTPAGVWKGDAHSLLVLFGTSVPPSAHPVPSPWGLVTG